MRVAFFLLLLFLLVSAAGAYALLASFSAEREYQALVHTLGSGEGARWAGMRTHRIMTEMMADLGYSSKLNAEREFLHMLRSEGRRAASSFLEAHAGDIGQRSTADLDVLLAET